MQCLEAGNSENTPIIFLHGMGTGPSAWQPQLDDLSQRYYVLAPFLPGYGEEAGAFSFETVREQISRLIERKVNAPVHLCGLSLGALVALDFVNVYPEQIRTITLSAGFVKLTDEAREQQRQSAHYVRSFDSQAFAEKVLSQLTRDVPSAFKSQALQEIASLSPTTLADLFELDFDASGWIAEVDKPALVLCGGEDKHNLELSKTLAEHLPRATFDLIAGAGHVANLDAPRVFTEKLERFIRRHS